MAKLKTYTIYYSFDGYGEVKVKAKSEEEATDRFFEGEWDEKEIERGRDYNIDEIEEVKNEKK